MCISISLARQATNQPWYSVLIQKFLAPASICTTNTTQTAYLNDTVALIKTFEQNSTYNTVLQLEASNFVSYITNTTNQALLHSNCTAFVIGVKAAKIADAKAEKNREKIAKDIRKQIDQIPHTVTGSHGFNDMDIDLDSSERDEHHF